MAFQIIALEKENFAPLFELDDEALKAQSAVRMVDADLAEGDELAKLIEKLFALPRVEFIHLHWAKFGCYAAKVVRA